MLQLNITDDELRRSFAYLDVHEPSVIAHGLKIKRLQRYFGYTQAKATELHALWIQTKRFGVSQDRVALAKRLL